MKKSRTGDDQAADVAARALPNSLACVGNYFQPNEEVFELFHTPPLLHAQLIMMSFAMTRLTTSGWTVALRTKSASIALDQTAVVIYAKTLQLRLGLDRSLRREGGMLVSEDPI